MYLIWVILSVVSYLPMFTPGLKGCKEIMFCTSVEPMNMEQLLKLKPYNKRKLLNKFAIISIPFTEMFTNGLILASITLEELQHNGMQKSVNRFS